MKNKTLAFIGIAIYVFSIPTSATDLEGNLEAPVILIILSSILTLWFVYTGAKRIWIIHRKLALAFVASFILQFFLELIPSAVFIILLINAVKVIYLVTLIWTILLIYQMHKYHIREPIHLKIEVGNDLKNNKISIDFSKIRFLLLVGSTATGKTIFHYNLYMKLTEQNSVSDIGFVFLDMTRIDSWDSSHTIAREFNPEKAINILEKIASEKSDSQKHIFIHVEECDMFIDSTSDKAVLAVKSILENRNDITIIYSTSRPDPRSALRPDLLKLVDTKVIFKQNSEEDLKYILNRDELVKIDGNEKLLVDGSREVMLQPFTETEVDEIEKFTMK